MSFWRHLHNTTLPRQRDNDIIVIVRSVTVAYVLHAECMLPVHSVKMRCTIQEAFRSFPVTSYSKQESL